MVKCVWKEDSENELSCNQSRQGVGHGPTAIPAFLKDTENTHAGYIGRTEYGTEEVLREALALGGMAKQEIDIAFRRAG